ncbi:hypothetical protein BH10ACI2_BH10ACI2_08020 [soil metagenome]
MCGDIMRKVIYGRANSLDNSFASKDGDAKWLLWSDETMELMKDVLMRFDTMVMRRKEWSTTMENFPEENL